MQETIALYANNRCRVGSSIIPEPRNRNPQAIWQTAVRFRSFHITFWASARFPSANAVACKLVTAIARNVLQ